MPDIVVGKDAYMRVDNETTFAKARNMGTAETLNTTAVRSNAAVKASANGDGDAYDCYRSFFAFDTSGVTVKPNSATLKLYGYQYTTADVIIIKVDAGATGDSDSDFVAGDYSKTGTFDASTAYSAEIATWSTTGYNEITLNATALADMKSLSEFKIALIEHDYDYLKAVPANSLTRRSGVYYVEETDTAKRPVIDYDAGPPEYDANIPASASFGDDHVINTYDTNVLSSQYERTGSAQVPFILGTPGPISLRGRSTAPIIDIGKKKT